jgi:hypothetical protein
VGSSSSLACRRRVRLSPLGGSVVLPRWETVKPASVTIPYFNKRLCHLCYGGQARLLLLSAGLSGEGAEQVGVAAMTLQRWRSGFLERATSTADSKRQQVPAAAISGQRVGPAARDLQIGSSSRPPSLEDLLRLWRGSERCYFPKWPRPRWRQRRPRRQVNNRR